MLLQFIVRLRKKEICPTCHDLSVPEEPLFKPPTRLMAQGS